MKTKFKRFISLSAIAIAVSLSSGAVWATTYTCHSQIEVINAVPQSIEGWWTVQSFRAAQSGYNGSAYLARRVIVSTPNGNRLICAYNPDGVPNLVPEWIAVKPDVEEKYCYLNNSNGFDCSNEAN